MQNDQPNPWDPTSQPPQPQQYNPYPGQASPQQMPQQPFAPPVVQPTAPAAPQFYGSSQPPAPQPQPLPPSPVPPAQAQTPFQPMPAQQPWPNQPPLQQQYQGQYKQPYPTQQSKFKKFVSNLPLRPKAIAAIAGVAVLIVAAVFVATQLIHRPITHDDVLSAIQAAQSADQDLNDARQTYDDETIGTNSNATTVATAVSTINSKLADAQTQIGILQKSSVLGDGKVNAAYQAYQKKFGPYVDYLQQNSNDFAKLGPVVNSAIAKLQSASNNIPSSNSKMASYLSNLQTQLEATNNQLKSIQVQSDTNKQGLAAFKSYISSWLDAISQARSDLGAGKDYFTVVEDLFGTDSAQTKLYDALDNIDKQESANLKRLDPENEFNALTSALATLSLSIKS